MELSIIVDGQKYPYSRARLKKDNPTVSFPMDLTKVDLSQYNVVIEEPKVREPVPVPQEEKVEVVAQEAAKPEPSPSLVPAPDKVPMHCFLWGLREYGLRVQFERYYLRQEGFARDYWFTAPMVSRKHVCVQHFKREFALSEGDLDVIFTSAFGIEE